MDLRSIHFASGIVLLALAICGCEALPQSLVARIPVQLPVYIGQQPSSAGSVYPYYYYYPQSQYPNTGVIYQTPVTGVQYPYYGWPNTPAYKPSVPAPAPTPTYTANGNTGDPNNPKNDVEYIY